MKLLLNQLLSQEQFETSRAAVPTAETHVFQQQYVTCRSFISLPLVPLFHLWRWAGCATGITRVGRLVGLSRPRRGLLARPSVERHGCLSSGILHRHGGQLASPNPPARRKGRRDEKRSGFSSMNNKWRAVAAAEAARYGDFTFRLEAIHADLISVAADRRSSFKTCRIHKCIIAVA